jgi:hypothetical protein
MADTDQAHVASNSHSTQRALIIALYAALLMLEVCLIASLALRKHAYLPCLETDYAADLALATCIPLALALASVGAIAVSLFAGRRWWIFPAAVIALVTPLICCAGFLFWMGVIYGLGSATTVARAAEQGVVYRLDDTTPGDPPMPVLILLECRPTPFLCRQVGMISNLDVHPPLPELTLRPGADGLSGLADGSLVARYVNGVLACVPSVGAAQCDP